MNILVSACLLGNNCRYDGKSVPCRQVMDLAQKHRLFPVCPEQMGGLPTPRLPSEIVNGKVLRSDGVSVDGEYRRGAEAALKTVLDNGITLAIMKSASPSCGNGRIHNGRFDGGMTDGDGITTALLREYGITVINETELNTIDELTV